MSLPRLASTFVILALVPLVSGAAVQRHGALRKSSAFVAGLAQDALEIGNSSIQSHVKPKDLPEAIWDIQRHAEEMVPVPEPFIVPMVPQEEMTWWQFTRVVERRVFLMVHKWYVVAWCAAVAFLSLLTAAFLGLNRSDSGKDDADVCQPLEDIPTGESGNSGSLVQKGYVYAGFGSAIFWLWVLLPMMGYLQLTIICLDHYFFAMHVPDLTWTQWAQPFLLVFVMSHLALFLQTQYMARARVFFMTQAPLSGADCVLIQDTSDITDGGQLLEVQTVEGTEVRFIEYTCIRYVWSIDHFAPGGSEAGLSAKTAHGRVQGGGLSQEEVTQRKVVGPNVIHVPVPGVMASLLEEFLTPLYCFQFAVMWLYLFIDSWNISAIWAVWTAIAGITKALCSVRANRLEVQKLARTEGHAIVFRAGGWKEMSSADIVPGDVIRVEEGTVLCDSLVIRGGAVVNESMLTGEPMPVPKFPVEETSAKAVTPTTHKQHILFTGTIVMQESGDSGEEADVDDMQSTVTTRSKHCIAVVLNTGPMTVKGSLIRTVLFPKPIKFKFTDQLPRFYACTFVYVCCLFTVVQVGANTGSWIYSIYIGFTILAQSLNPLLPTSITLGQTMGSSRLKSEMGIACLSPQRLPIAGKIHCMVMDKTGTITKEGMDFRGIHASKDGAFDDSPLWAEDGRLGSKGIPEKIDWALASCHAVKRLVKDGSYVGNAVEVSMLNASDWKLSEDSRSLHQEGGGEIKILKTLEFDQTRATSGSVIQVGEKKFALIKGSYERFGITGQGGLMKSGVPANFDEVTKRYAAESYYVLGMGIKEIKEELGEAAPREELEAGLTFLGLLLFRNEMKVDSPDAVDALRGGGVRSVICTGDNADTGAAIARSCGMVGADAIVLLGDVTKEGQYTWRSVPDNTEVAHKAVMESYDDAELVLTKTAFRKLEESGDMATLYQRVRVYARMKPDDKVAVVQTYQAQGFVVGMVGDGGNDCGAMRAAHVGLALSEAEASIVAPFSSGAEYGTGEKSLMAVPHLLRFGRATLQTNLGTFLFFAVYGFTLPSSKLLPLLTMSANMAEWDWMFIDIFLGVGFVILMTTCWPAEKLSPIRPTAALMEGRAITSVLLHVLSFFTFYLMALKILWAQPFYVGYHTTNLEIPAHEWAKKGDNFDCAVTFVCLATQLVSAGYAGCLGAEHRRNVLKNIGLTVAYVLLLSWLVVLVAGGPTDMHCVFRTNCDSHTSRKMYVPFVQEFSAGNVGGCFLGPQLEGWKEEQLGSRYRVPDNSNKCFPADGFDPEKELNVPSEALFGMGSARCLGPHNCFNGFYRTTLSLILVAQSVLSILCHKLLVGYHPAHKTHFAKL